MAEHKLASLRRVRRQAGFVLLAAVFLSSGSVAAIGLAERPPALLPGNGGMGLGMGLPVTGLEAEHPESGRPLPQPVRSPMNLTAGEMDLLARCISGESRGEPHKGQVAVGAVILNRVKSPVFPNTVREVIYARNQFEVVRNGQINLAPTDSSVAAARAAAAGEDPTGGALYFFDPSKTRNAFLWNRPLKVTIGCHRFTG